MMNDERESLTPEFKTPTRGPTSGAQEAIYIGSICYCPGNFLAAYTQTSESWWGHTVSHCEDTSCLLL
jgi:hypothetical protein